MDWHEIGGDRSGTNSGRQRLTVKRAALALTVVLVLAGLEVLVFHALGKTWGESINLGCIGFSSGAAALALRRRWRR